MTSLALEGSAIASAVERAIAVAEPACPRNVAAYRSDVVAFDLVTRGWTVQLEATP